MTFRQTLPIAALVALCAFDGADAQSPVVLTLGGAARLAAERNPTPEAARQRAAQAEARVRQRKADFLPTLSAAAFAHENNLNSASFPFSFADPATGRPLFDPNGQIIGPVKMWDARGTIRQTIYDASSFAKLNAARASATAAGSDAAGVAQQAAAIAAGAYVRAARADAQLSARVADSALAASLLAIARDQVTAGVGVALDVTRAQSQLSSVRSQLIAARGERDHARLDLLRALGLAADTPITLGDSLFGLPATAATTPEDAALQRARSTRADLRAIDEQVAAAGRQLDAIRAERYPTLSAFADQGGNGKSTSHLLNTYEWGVQVSVPIFDGFRREGREDEQRAAIREAEARRHDLSDQAAADVRAALLDLQTAREQLAAADERFSLANQELSQARDRFSAGVTGNADVITASISVNAARTQMVDARAALQAARVALARAQGTVTELP